MDGLHTITSNYGVQETVDRIVRQVESEGWHVFARIDHSGEAHKKGIDLRPTQVILFGNPSIGTRLMLDQQTSAIDLPVKALIWENADGLVRIGYNLTEWLKERHHITDDDTLDEIGRVVQKVCTVAAGIK